MATEVYHKVGRGGAGNFYTKAEKAAAIAVDLEAQKTSKPVEPIVSDRAPAENAYSGRGGAGNWYSPKEVRATTSEPSTVFKSAAPVKPAFQGRGGAGNYNDEEAEKRLQEQKAAEEAKRWEQEAIEMVDIGLRPPEKAYLATERAELGE